MAKTLLEALLDFRKKDRISFHMPGHKHGAGISQMLKKHAMEIDVTEFAETDNLQEPEGILKDAQERAAKIFGAGKSFFLTNGSSVGLLAAILGSTKPNDTILVDRTCHRAVISALVLGGLKPQFIYPAFDEDFSLYRGITGRTVKRALDRFPEAVGAVITSPTYYGICSDVWGIAACLHNSGKFLIVDEAHGAHFAFSEALPKPALLQGADLCVQSAHKTLSALGQTALLHIGKQSLVSAEDVARVLRTLQTTSPSYLLMASLDEAIGNVHHTGERKIRELLSSLTHLKKRIRQKTALQIVDGDDLHCPQDGLRLLVDFEKAGISGIEAAQLLMEVCGIYPEMADERYVVFILTAANTKEEIKKLEDALFSVGTTLFAPGDRHVIHPLPEPEIACLPAEAWNAERKTLPIDAAEGEICAEIVGICPPGAAIAVPGQRLDMRTLAYIQQDQQKKEIEVAIKRVNQ